MPKVNSSVEALQLLQRAYRIKTLITAKRFNAEHKKLGLTTPVKALISQLVSDGYLIRIPGERGWRRTRKLVSEEMKRAVDVANKTRIRIVTNPIDPNAPQNIVRDDLEPWYAELFFFPRHEVRLTGRVHYLEG